MVIAVSYRVDHLNLTYLEKRGVSDHGTDAIPTFIGRADGTGQMLLPANATVLQVKHDLSHYFDFRNLGFIKFVFIFVVQLKKSLFLSVCK